MGKTGFRIRTFDDALWAAFRLCDGWSNAHTAMLLDNAGRVLNAAAFTRSWQTEDHALDWALCCGLNDGRITRLVLLSAICRDPVCLREDDVGKFKRVRQVFGDSEVDVLDWIQCDGNRARSLAFTTSAGTWGHESHHAVNNRP